MQFVCMFVCLFVFNRRIKHENNLSYFSKWPSSSQQYIMYVVVKRAFNMILHSCLVAFLRPCTEKQLEGRSNHDVLKYDEEILHKQSKTTMSIFIELEDGHQT